jgi:hypothetical protein
MEPRSEVLVTRQVSRLRHVTATTALDSSLVIHAQFRQVFP